MSAISTMASLRPARGSSMSSSIRRNGRPCWRRPTADRETHRELLALRLLVPCRLGLFEGLPRTRRRLGCRVAFCRSGAVEREQRRTGNNEERAGGVVAPGVEVKPKQQHGKRNRNEDKEEPDPGRAIVGPRQRFGIGLQRRGLALQPAEIIERFTVDHGLRECRLLSVRILPAPVSMLTERLGLPS